MSRIYATGNEQSDEYGEPTFVDDEKGTDRPTFPAEMAKAGMGAKYGEQEKPWHPTAIGANKCELCGQPITTEDAQFWNTEDMYIPKICIKCKHGLVYMGSEQPIREINKTYLHPVAEKRWRP